MNSRKGTRNWTIEEMNYMTYEWGIVSVKIIAKHLSRTPVAIMVKSKRMHLGSPYWKTKITAHRLSHLLGIDQHTITDYWIPKCDLKCRKMIMKFKKRMYLIAYDDLMEWLEKNQDKWDSRRFKRFTLKIEPEWLRQKRILDSYEPKRKYQKWTEFEDKRLLNLFYREGKSYKEISAIMGRSYESVQRRLSRIRPYKKVKTINTNLKEEEMRIYRHGDILLKEVKEIPKGAKRRPDKIVAYGEATGHNHTLVGEAEILDFMEKQFVKVNSPAEITHPEHKTIKIEPGQYEVIRENEFDYFDEEIKRVQD